MSERPLAAAAGGATGIFDQDLLDRCISCGFCLPACPTYKLTGDEASSPRGRITLMRALATGSLDADDATLREQSSFCLGCRACEPVCPAGVQYGQLLEQWRVHQWRGRRRPVLARLLTLAAGRRWALRVLGRVRGAAHWRPDRTGTASQPPASPAAGSPPASAGAPAGPQLMLGCFERGLFPGVSRAAAGLVPDACVPTDQGCCGALHAHNGDLAGAERLARELGDALPGRIVTTSGGCAAHLSGVLGRDRVVELSEYLAGGSFGEVRVDGRRARVALQDSCHLRNGMDVWREPRKLLRQVADYVELPSAAACCGAAGTYALLRPKDSRRVLDPKLDEIEAAGIDYLVVVNPGCQRQLIGGLRRRRSRVRVLHIAELLAMAGES
ncbi:(Fe-S)-binding protein [Rugosimonospora africana]|uniref:Glycolate oxidase iron-sulfur subunit n=1 Tax=Rugosimonospora africana TaxID=556532 RepID=A0A8J3QQF6_9ACTN|nr:(Fe-S)-binding protein [Rugosimonospora africana]GIH13897.1 glycolate oxidase iron-sulfur subunit [Rugosimonospora africana]